jgi:hypothetical protein
VRNESENLRIFLASPNDVSREREAVKRAVAEVNQTSAELLAIRFEVVGWDTHVHPAVGTDGQAVINEHIGDNYEILLAIIWTRLGQPTPRADSGTVEEYERAFKRRDQPPGGVPEIMLYASRKRIDPNVDATQLAAAQAFIARVQSDGLLTGHFRAPTNLRQSVRIHLCLFGKRWKTRKTATRLVDVPPHPTEVANSEVEAEQLARDGIERATAAMKSIAQDFALPAKEIIDTLGTAIKQRSADIGEAARKVGFARDLAANRVLDRLDNDLRDFSARVKALPTVIDDLFVPAMGQFGSTVAAMPELPLKMREYPVVAGAVAFLHAVLARLLDNMESATSSLSQLGSAIDLVPYPDTRSRSARREFKRTIDELVRQLSGALAVVAEVKHVVAELIDDSA